MNWVRLAGIQALRDWRGDYGIFGGSKRNGAIPPLGPACKENKIR